MIHITGDLHRGPHQVNCIKYDWWGIDKTAITFFRLAVVAMAGLAAEGLKYDKVVGQSADLFTLQVYIQYLSKTVCLSSI